MQLFMTHRFRELIKEIQALRESPEQQQSGNIRMGFASPPKKNHRPSYERDGNRGPLKGIDQQPLRLKVVSTGKYQQEIAQEVNQTYSTLVQ